jgi:hypothetical protein
MQVKVVIRGSPYSAVALGAIGEVVSKKYVGRPIEQWKVLFAHGATWTFYPDELEVLHDNEKAAIKIGAGAHA